MNDQDRATAFVLTWADDTVLVPTAREMSNALAEQFGAVRLEERRAVAAFLRQRAGWPSTPKETAIALGGVAISVERGEHGS